jgi:hypothetical protein
MDYSASIQDDDPAAASPWGNSPTSSPRHNRPGFNNAASEEPPAFPFGPQSSSGLGQDPTAPEGFQRPGTATTASGTDNGDTEGSTVVNEPVQQEAAPEAQTAPPQPGSNIAPEPSAQQPPAQEAAARPDQQPRKPSQHQHKLQAKITGLERTGKKDPILRFDIHVRTPRQLPALIFIWTSSG